MWKIHAIVTSTAPHQTPHPIPGPHLSLGTGMQQSQRHPRGHHVQRRPPRRLRRRLLLGRAAAGAAQGAQQQREQHGVAAAHVENELREVEWQVKFLETLDDWLIDAWLIHSDCCDWWFTADSLLIPVRKWKVVGNVWWHLTILLLIFWGSSGKLRWLLGLYPCWVVKTDSRGNAGSQLSFHKPSPHTHPHHPICGNRVYHILRSPIKPHVGMAQKTDMESFRGDPTYGTNELHKGLIPTYWEGRIKRPGICISTSCIILSYLSMDHGYGPYPSESWRCMDHGHGSGPYILSDHLRTSWTILDQVRSRYTWSGSHPHAHPAHPMPPTPQSPHPVQPPSPPAPHPQLLLLRNAPRHLVARQQQRPAPVLRQIHVSEAGLEQVPRGVLKAPGSPGSMAGKGKKP